MKENLKYVVGKLETGKPACVRFFGPVNEWSAYDFNTEFLYVQGQKPSKIVVLINSEGGSVVAGMSVFSVIQSCTIPVDCVIEGIAASMGSIIWAAGDNLYMHDYSLLMIHNPWIDNSDENDPNDEQVVKAFTSQIETIYQKRFGLTKEKVKEIMEGKENVDGTFFTAKEAVNVGILDKGHIIKTSKQVNEEVANGMKDVANGGVAIQTQSYRTMMDKIAASLDENKLISGLMAIPKQNTEQETKNQQVMEKENEKNISFSAVAAQLGFGEDVKVATVSSKITELLSVESKLKDTQAKVEELTIQLTGKTAEVTNISAELSDVKTKLQSYEDAEKAAKEAEVNALVDEAVKAGKIEESAKASWVNMAQSNIEIVKTTLASIPAREKITEAIATDPKNVQEAKNSITETEKEVQEKVEKVVNKFSFNKF